MLKRADLASSEAATSRCPSKRRYLNVPTTSPAVRHKRAPASTGWGLSLLIVHPEGYRYGPISRGDFTAREERGKIVLSAVPSSHGPMTRIRYSSLSLFRTGIGFGWVRSRKAFRRSCGARKPDADYMALSGGRATRTERSPGQCRGQVSGRRPEGNYRRKVQMASHCSIGSGAL